MELSPIKNNFLKILGLYTLLKIGYDNLGIGKYYTLWMIKSIPIIKGKIQEKIDKVRNDIKTDLNSTIKELDLNLHIPKIGIEPAEVVEQIKELNQIVPFETNQGRVSGCVYSNSKKIDYIFENVFPLLERSNPLHPDIFPGVRKMEAEVVNMCGNFLKSPNPQAGSFTSGGTESILLAMRCYKKMAQKKGLKGEIVLANSAHAAYWKAAEYFDMAVIEIDTLDEELSVEMVETTITPKTTVVICSAPSFNYGLVDDISGIANFCSQKNIYLHVDMCLGGFLIPFLDDIKCDFEIEGITSISLDTHKYGYGPKGGSVILYRNKELLKKHCFVKEDWSGGIYGTSNLSGSRSGSVIGLTWATMMSTGMKGYNNEAKRIRRLTLKLRNAIDLMQELYVKGKPDINIVAIGSDEFSIYLLCDRLKEAGWCLNILQNPASFHFCITSIHTDDMIDDFIRDIIKFTNEIMVIDNRADLQTASIYGTTQKVNDPEIIDDVVREYICCLMELL